MSTQQQPRLKNVLDSKHYSSVYSCKKCRYITKSLFFIQNHIKRQHSTNYTFFFDCAENTPEVYFCKECNFKTYDTVIFNIHLKEHNPSFQEFQENSKNEFSEFELKTEVYEEHELKPSENEEISWSLRELFPNKNKCTTFFKTRAIYQYIDNKNTKWFKCDKCMYQTKTEVNLINHKTVRHAILEKNRLFQCENCSYPNMFKCNIKNVKWFECEKCSSITELANSSKKHANGSNIYFSKKHAEWLYCNKCPYKVKRNYGHYLRNHIIAKHTPSENIKWFHCNKCDFKAKFKNNLKNHITHKHITSIIKWFQCENCAYKTKYKRDLKKHINSNHTPLENIQSDHNCDYTAKENRASSSGYDANKVFCSCGLVVGDSVIDVGLECSTFSNEKSGVDPTHVDGPGNLPLNGSDSTTTIEPGRSDASVDNFGVAQHQNRKSMSTSDRALTNALHVITGIADRINLPRSIVDRANNLFEQSHNAKNVRGRPNDAVASACLYIACRQEGVPRTFKEICVLSKISIREIGRCFKLILKALETSVHVITTGDFMSRFCSNLRLPNRVLRAATHIAQKAVEMDIVPGRSPISVASGAIYMASQASGDKRSQHEISDIAGVADVTIRQSYRQMYPHAVKLFPEGFKFVIPIHQLPQI